MNKNGVYEMQFRSAEFNSLVVSSLLVTFGFSFLINIKNTRNATFI